MKFLILAPPRCRTAWLSQLFTVGGCFCYHDLTAKVPSAEAVIDEMAMMEMTGSKVVGNSDSGNFAILEDVLESDPDTRLIWVARNIKDVTASLSRELGHREDDIRPKISRLSDHLYDLWQKHGGMWTGFELLDSESEIRDMWTFATRGSIPFPEDHYQQVRSFRIALKSGHLLETYERATDTDITRKARAILEG